MSVTKTYMNDRTLIELYNKFVNARQSLDLKSKQAIYDGFMDKGRYLADAFPAPIVAQDHVLSACNTLNRFDHDLHGLTAWALVFKAISERKRCRRYLSSYPDRISLSLRG
jgi:hypothetical protein